MNSNYFLLLFFLFFFVEVVVVVAVVTAVCVLYETTNVPIWDLDRNHVIITEKESAKEEITQREESTRLELN